MTIPDDDRMPYWFTEKQLDRLACAVGTAIENGIHNLTSVNDEIGVAKARQQSSSIRRMMPMFMKNTAVMLYLSTDECRLISSLELPEEILKQVSDGI